ncbi:MAG TPA: hypothetical protein VM914_01935 [Pyrinomonadaceae bacterium]|jgi:hypothetical protein|nr:hypothetical protein [Pyrinomonadaceae bacterium]
MYSLLLRKALPFALTFILGSLVGGLFKAVGIGGGPAFNSRSNFYRHGGRHSCGERARQRYLVAESKPLQITFKPDASWPDDFKPDASWPGEYKAGYKFPGAWVRVTFGSDGKVQWVEPSDIHYPSLGAKGDKVVWERAERAARQIQFEPETVNGLPVTVMREVEIQFMGE